MWEGYASLAGQELINSTRATTYAGNAGLAIQCEPCETTAAALAEDSYVDIAQDPAPWYDANSPQSTRFYGVFGLTVAGYAVNPVTRTPTQRVGEGATIGPLRKTSREIIYTVALLAADDCALSYGLEWLASSLNGTECGGSVCGGDELCVFSCCPGSGAQGALGEFGDQEFRHLYDVGLLEGPSLGEVRYLTGGQIWAEVTFTLVAGKPWIYREPLITLSDWVPLIDGEVVQNIDPDAVYDECLQPKPCLEDPDCPQPALPPRPPAPLSPCFPTGQGNFYRTRIRVSPLDQLQWLETVPVLEVRTGNGIMRRLVVRFWANPQDNDCDLYNDPCNACMDINVSYLPRGSTLTVDGRVQRAVVECPQVPIGTTTATPTIYGPRGESFEWPVFGCPTGLCIEVWSRFEYTDPGAVARVQLVPRADVG